MSDYPLQQVQQRTPFGSTNWSGNTVTTSYDPRLLEDFWAQTDQRQNQRNVYGLAADAAGRAMGGPGADPRAGTTPMVSQLPAQSWQRGFDTSGMIGIPGADDMNAQRQRVEDATFDRYASRLDPRFQREQTDLETKLREQGFVPGTEAFDEQFGNFSRGKTDAYEQAARDAVTTGGAEASRVMADALRGRATQFGEAQQALTNRNTGNQLDLSQHLAAAGLQNDVSNTEFNRNRAVSGDARSWLQTAQSGLPQGTMLPQLSPGLQGIDEGQASQDRYWAMLEQLWPMITGGGNSGGGAAGGIGSLVGQGGQALINWLRGVTSPDQANWGNGSNPDWGMGVRDGDYIPETFNWMGNDIDPALLADLYG